jgi:hypothetical protein
MPGERIVPRALSIAWSRGSEKQRARRRRRSALELTVRYSPRPVLESFDTRATFRASRSNCVENRADEATDYIYMRYVVETQDEKMFRVVRDRERWFQTVMGETYEVDEAVTDQRAAGVPLRPSVRRQLAMKLHP